MPVMTQDQVPQFAFYFLQNLLYHILPDKRLDQSNDVIDGLTVAQLTSD